MAKKFSLSTGTNHIVAITVRRRKYIVEVDGQLSDTFKLGFLSSYFGVVEDFLIGIENIKYILSVRGKKIRLACEGRYIDNGEEFIPKEGFPKWFWIFIIIHVLPLAILGFNIFTVAIAYIPYYMRYNIQRKY